MQLSRRSILAGASALIALPCGALAAASVPLIETGNGKVSGKPAGRSFAWLGIPYAAPPTGAQRFLPPQPAPHWAGVRDCISYGPRCPQIERPGPAIFAPFAANTGESEDCLSLNIWSSLPRGKRPVMVWLHGGGFANWSGASPVYEGSRLAGTGRAVVVTLNHRLNLFGFLDLGGDARNVGMLDIVAALAWVRDNIAGFGGDPGNVTIFGQSGGGCKVAALLAMPAAKGLFHKAIIQSGPLLRGVAPARSEAAAAAFKAALGSRPADATTAQLLAAMAKIGPLSRAFAPVVDGATLPAHPFEPIAAPFGADVPLLIGTNRTESTAMFGDPGIPLQWGDLAAKLKPLLGPADPDKAVAGYRAAMPDAGPNAVFHAIATRQMFGSNSDALADAKAVQRAPVYRYEFAWETPVDGGKWHSPHTLEIPFVFDTADRAAVLVGAGGDLPSMAQTMSETWLRFAERGNPNNRHLPNWPRYTARGRNQMTLDRRPTLHSDPNAFARQALVGAPLTAITDG